MSVQNLFTDCIDPFLSSRSTKDQHFTCLCCMYRYLLPTSRCSPVNPCSFDSLDIKVQILAEKRGHSKALLLRWLIRFFASRSRGTCARAGFVVYVVLRHVTYLGFPKPAQPIEEHSKRAERCAVWITKAKTRIS